VTEKWNGINDQIITTKHDNVEMQVTLTPGRCPKMVMGSFTKPWNVVKKRRDLIYFKENQAIDQRKNILREPFEKKKKAKFKKSTIKVYNKVYTSLLQNTDFIFFLEKLLISRAATHIYHMYICAFFMMANLTSVELQNKCMP